MQPFSMIFLPENKIQQGPFPVSFIKQLATPRPAGYQWTPRCSSWERWWKTKLMAVEAASQAAWSTSSWSPRLSVLWFHWARSDVQSEPSGGGHTWRLLTQRRQCSLGTEDRAMVTEGPISMLYRYSEMMAKALHPPVMCVTQASLIQGKQLLQLA